MRKIHSRIHFYQKRNQKRTVNDSIIINHDNKSYKEYKDYTIKVESGEITETDN